MKILFLDDSYVGATSCLGYGGYCVDAEFIRPLGDDILAVKQRHGVPLNVELKWSPRKGHFFKTKFKGSRPDLYADLLDLLTKYDTKTICAIHCLSECYGVRLYNWDLSRVSLWAAKEQFKFLAERFELNYLDVAEDTGIIISDQYGSREGEEALIADFSVDLLFGTPYNDLKKIVLPPLMTRSYQSPHVQLADAVVGVTVAALGGSKYGNALVELVAKRFLAKPAKPGSGYVSTFTGAVKGYGLKLFPSGFKPKDSSFLDRMSAGYIVRNGVIEPRLGRPTPKT